MELRLPELSENNDETVITGWHIKENEHVKKGQDLIEVATDKATFDVPAPCDGVLIKILRKEGDSVKANEVIAEIQENRG